MTEDARLIVLEESWDKESAVLAARDLAAAIGFGQNDQLMISMAASELSTNILRYAGRGELHIRALRDGNRGGIEILAVDRGPGIADVAMALKDHYSTEQGSLGLGLPSVRRIMDELQVETGPRAGTRILARKWRPNEDR